MTEDELSGVDAEGCSDDMEWVAYVGLLSELSLVEKVDVLTNDAVRQLFAWLSAGFDPKSPETKLSVNTLRDTLSNHPKLLSEILRLEDEVRLRHGRELAQIYRWRKMYDLFCTDMSFEPSGWLELFGPTGVGVTHQEWFTRFLALLSVSDDQCADDFKLSDVQLHALLLSSPIHDLGEIVTSDISALERTDNHEQEEGRAAIKLLRGFGDPEPLITAYLAAVLGHDPVVGDFRKAVERFEYVITVIWLYLKKDAANPYFERFGMKVIAWVLGNELPAVLEYANKRGGNFKSFLMSLTGIIQKMFAETSEVLATDDDPIVKTYYQNYLRSRKQWIDIS